MFDFKLTDTGDIILSSLEDTKKLRVSLFIPDDNNFSAQRVSFFTGFPETTFNDKFKGQKVSFKKSNFIMHDSNNEVLKNYEEIAQNIILQLKSELNGSLNPEVGSMFYKHKHDMIISERDLENIATTAQQVVDTVIEGATVNIEHVIDDRMNFFATQVIKITVLYEDEVLTEYFI